MLHIDGILIKWSCLKCHKNDGAAVCIVQSRQCSFLYVLSCGHSHCLSIDMRCVLFVVNMSCFEIENLIESNGENNKLDRSMAWH